jgi:hypothetical protein
MNSTGSSGTATPRMAIAMNEGTKFWSPDELQRIVAADDLHIAPRAGRWRNLKAAT